MSSAPADRGDAIVACHGLSRTYEDGPATVVALSEATFGIRPGEQVAICGPSGSGKSTLMNLLGLLDVPSSGTYHLAGLDVSGLDEPVRAGLRSRAIGFVFQSFHLLGTRTAAENVELALLYSAVPRRRRTVTARDVLDRVGLGHRGNAVVTTLSGGERQRVAIARAIAHRPQLLLADEPTGNLDTATSDQVMAVLDDLHAGGLTQIIVTHSDALAARIGRRLDVLDGHLVDRTPSAAP